MTPLTHAKNSVKLFGGKLEDYLSIHLWFDATKLHVADLRHRVVLHNSFGIGLCEQVHGVYLVNSDGKNVAVRKIAEQHVKEDLGFIPSLDQALVGVPISPLVAPRLRHVVKWCGLPGKERTVEEEEEGEKEGETEET